MWEYGLDRAGSGQGQVAGTCECGNEPSGLIKCGEFLDQLKAGQLPKKESAPWGIVCGFYWTHFMTFLVRPVMKYQ